MEGKKFVILGMWTGDGSSFANSIYNFWTECVRHHPLGSGVSLVIGRRPSGPGPLRSGMGALFRDSSRGTQTSVGVSRSCGSLFLHSPTA